MKYVAFLRGINVGGHKIIKMTELARIFGECGLREVRTLIASGNVLFEGPGPASATLAEKIGKELEVQLGYEVGVVLRTMPELEKLARSQPFKGMKLGESAKAYVTLLDQASRLKTKLPFRSSVGDFEILKQKGRDVFSVSYKVRGKFGGPSLLVEREVTCVATTRNWNTIEKIVGLA